MPQKILVTGSEGLIGRILVPELKKDGHELVLLDKKSENPVDLLNDDILNYFNGVDTVIHLAVNGFWINHKQAQENIDMTGNVLESAKNSGVERIVYASSINVYDYSTIYLDGKKINEETPLSPHAKSDWKERKESVIHYSQSKIYNEALVQHYYEKYGISAINLRFGAIGSNNKPYKNEPDDYAIWLSHEDLIEIMERAIHFNGFESIVCTSNNSDNFVDLSHLEKVLGYKPKSNSQIFREIYTLPS